jgi:hypothetical protein
MEYLIDAIIALMAGTALWQAARWKTYIKTLPPMNHDLPAEKPARTPRQERLDQIKAERRARRQG